MSGATTRPWLCPVHDEATGWRCPADQHDTVEGRRQGCVSGKARDARYRYDKALRADKVPRKCDATGLRRRIEACHYMGWPGSALAAELGVSHDRVNQALNRASRPVLVSTVRRWVPILERLAMRSPEPFGGFERRTYNWARRRGFRHLLAWNNIDDPAERAPLSPALGDQVIELAGRAWPLWKIADELDLSVEQVREHLTERFTAEAARGFSYSQIAQRFGVTITRVARHIRAVELEPLDPYLPQAVLEGAVPLHACSEREQPYVVDRLWSRVVAENPGGDRFNPSLELAGWLGVDEADIERIRATARKRALKAQKEAS